jgi:hypothetical protein
MPLCGSGNTLGRWFGLQVLEEGGCLPWNRTRQSSTSCRIGLSLTLRKQWHNSFPGVAVGENCSTTNKGKWNKESRGSKVGFALQHLPQDDAFWSRVVFSDEKSFQSCPNGRIRVYRPRNTWYEACYVDATDRSGHFSVNMWACL